MIYTFAWSPVAEDGEVFFAFRSFPEIIAAIPGEQYSAMSDAEISDYTHSALITALKARISTREPLPHTDNESTAAAAGFVRLSVTEAMKLELYKVYLDNCESVADMARKMDKSPTLVRRLLDLTHPSKVEEIDAALAFFNKRLRHSWDLVAVA
jgi:antitoxin HicB